MAALRLALVFRPEISTDTRHTLCHKQVRNEHTTDSCSAKSKTSPVYRTRNPKKKPAGF